jgi:hypothetical protein
MTTAALVAVGAPALADEEETGLTYTVGDLRIGLSFEAGLGFFTVPNAQNGAGSFSANGTRAGGRSWSEGFVMPGADLSYGLGAGNVYGGLKVIGMATRGAGDAALESATSDRPESLGIEELKLGWKSGSSFSSLGEDAIDLSVGRQAFTVGDGFLILEGTANGGRRGAQVIGPRGAFDRTAILRLNTEPVRADIFHLESVTDQNFMHGDDAPKTQLYGGNIEWFGSSEKDAGRFEYEKRAWYVGATVLHLYDADRNLAPERDGMNVYAIRTGGAIFSQFSEALKDFALFSEYAIERNDDSGSRLRANAWYIEPQYTFSTLPWQPSIAYRYAHFSGDSNTGDDTSKSWDPLFTGGGPRGFATWDQGEIFAQYVGENSNLNTHMVHLRVRPTDDLAIGAVYYRHRYDEPAQAGVSSSKLMNELDLYTEWETPVPGLGVAVVLGAARAGSGREEELAATAGTSPADRTTYLGALMLSYSF